MRVTLGDHRPAEGRERSVHGSGLVAVFSVTDPHFAPIGLLLRILQASQEQSKKKKDKVIKPKTVKIGKTKNKKSPPQQHK